LAVEFSGGGGMVADGASSIAIGAYAKEVLAAHLEHVGDLLENSCDLFVLHHPESWSAQTENHGPKFFLSERVQQPHCPSLPSAVGNNFYLIRKNKRRAAILELHQVHHAIE